MPLAQSNRPRIFAQTADLNCAWVKLDCCAWPVMMRRAESATAVSSVWLAKKTIAVSMMANISARNGAATMPNSTAAMPSSRRAKRRTVLKRSKDEGESRLVLAARPARIAWIMTPLPRIDRAMRTHRHQAICLIGFIRSKIELSNFAWIGAELGSAVHASLTTIEKSDAGWRTQVRTAPTWPCCLRRSTGCCGRRSGRSSP